MRSGVSWFELNSEVDVIKNFLDDVLFQGPLPGTELGGVLAKKIVAST
jgi:hypothetical protein